MPSLEGVSNPLPLFCFLPLDPEPLFSLLPEPLELEPLSLSPANHKVWAKLGLSFFGFNRLHPCRQSFHRPVPLIHEVVVEKMGDDVLDPHLAPHPDPPAVARTLHFLQHPVAPNAFDAERSPVFVVDGLADCVKRAPPSHCGHAKRTTLLCFGEMLSTSPRSQHRATQKD